MIFLVSRLSFLCAFGLLFFLVSIAESIAKPTEYKKYTNKVHGFSLMLSKSWTVEEFSLGANVARFSVQKDHQMANCTVTIVPEKRFVQSQSWLDENINFKSIDESLKKNLIEGMRSNGTVVRNLYVAKVSLGDRSREAIFFDSSFDSVSIGRTIYLSNVHLPYSVPGRQIDLSCRGGGLSQIAATGSRENFQKEIIKFFSSFKIDN